MRTTDERLTRLVKAIDKFVADNKDKQMKGFVVLLGQVDEANQQKLRELAEKEKITIPLTLSVNGAKGPGSYKLDAKADVTALVTKGNKVAANFVLTLPAPTDAKAQEAEVAQIIEAAKKLFE